MSLLNAAEVALPLVARNVNLTDNHIPTGTPWGTGHCTAFWNKVHETEFGPVDAM